MSRNFELLQRLEQLRPSAQTENENSAATAVVIERHGPGFAGAERSELGRMVRRLFLAPTGTPPRVIVFAAVDAHAACTRICARTAELLAAQVNGSVCVVDANLRDSNLHEYFGVSNRLGLADAVQDSAALAEITTRVSGSNLTVLPHGSPVTNCEELLNSDRMRARIAEVRMQFDYVIVNAPAVGVYPDPILIGHHSDGLVLVLEADATSRETALRAKADVESANVRLLGVVLNNRKFPIPAPLYARL